MIEGLKPYAEYKESGLTWLDRIPVGWDEQRSKYLFREVDLRSANGVELRLSMSQRHGLIPSADVEEKRLVSETNIGGKICEPCDLVLNRLKAHLGVFALARQKGLVSPDYTVLRAIGPINSHYFCTLYRSPYCGQELRRTAKGIVEGFLRLYTDQFYDIRVPVPPPDEQAAIVRFLDHANRKIDGFIRAKRKLIGLLNEQKQAIIHRAVTRGLHSDAPIKASGIPWLGDIPAHWEVRRMKNVGNTKIGLTYSPGDVTESTGSLVLRASNIKNGQTVRGDDVFVRKSIPDGLRVRTGDILICARSGSRSLVGKSALIPRELEGVTFGAFMSLFRSPINDFIFWVLNSNLFKFVMAEFETSTINQLTQGELNKISIPVPPRTEQIEIIGFIQASVERLTTAIARTEREIALMQEYRTRLTADLVTGKLDVREAAAHLPSPPAETTAEPASYEPLDDTDAIEIEDS